MISAPGLTAFAASSNGITEYPVPTASSGPVHIATGSDGNLWFTELNASKIARITPAGDVTEWPTPTFNSCCDLRIAAEADGDLWYTAYSSNRIGRVTTSGSITEYGSPGGGPNAITQGPDGNVWFSENVANDVVVMSTAGAVLARYPIPTGASGPTWLTPGPDRNVWLAEISANKIARITTSGVFTEYTVPTANSGPGGIVAGPDGNLWFTEQNVGKYARISTQGVITEDTVPTPGSTPAAIVKGSDQNLWFSDNGANQLGRVTTSARFDGYALPTSSAGVNGATSGPDGNVWFTERGANQIGFIKLPAGPVGGAFSDAQQRGGRNPALACSAAVNGGGGSPIHGDPVNSATGDFFETQIDVHIEGRGCPLGFARTYNSTAAASSGPLGYGWQANVAMSLAVSGSTATIIQEGGSQVSFMQSGSAWVTSAPRFIATLTHNGDGTWTFVRQARDTYTFNSSGQLTSTADLNGYTEAYTYDASNQLITITDNAGRSLTLSWSGGSPTDKITEVDDANVSPTRKVQYQYNDGSGNLTDVIDVGGGHWQFTYDASHRITVMKDPKCYFTSGCPGVQNHYDASGRVDWQKDQLNRQTTFAYSGDPMTAQGGSTTVTDPKGNVTVDSYQWGLLVSTTSGSGTPDAGTTSFLYDESTLGPTSVTDANGKVTTMTYDSNGNVLTHKDPLGDTTTNTYNSFNQLLTTTDPLGVTTTMTYDGKGNLTSVTRPLGGTTAIQTVTYNHTDASFPGDVTSMVDPDNNSWSYGYDNNGYRNSVTDPLGNQATMTYNADGWLLSSVSPRGNVTGCNCSATYTTTYGRDSYGNLTTVTDPNGHVTRRHYDADQNLDYLQDGNQSGGTCTLGASGPCTQYVYDLANQATKILRADGTSLITDYNSDGTVADQKDGLGVAIQTYGYDHQGRVNSVSDALGNVTRYTRDAFGNVLTKQDPAGNCGATPKSGCTSYSYDADNRLAAITYSDGVTPNVSSIVYDADGQRTSMSDGSGTSTWTWDRLHRLTSYVNGAGSQVQYQYNLRDLVTALAYPGGSCGATPSLCVTRGYDSAGRWTSLTDWNANQTTFGYDPDSNLTTETLPSSTGVVDTFGFDQADNLSSIADVKGSASLFSATYNRDAANQLSSDSSALPSTNTFRYTALEQLCYAASSNSSACSAPPSGSSAYQYDAGDNLTQTGSTTQAFNAAHQLCWTASLTSASACAAPPIAASSYTYDNRGNRTSLVQPGGTTLRYGFDQANRLIQLSQQIGTTVSAIGSYSYNGDGLRMSKTVSGGTSQFTWDVVNGLPLMIQEGSTRYVYGPGGRPLERIATNTNATLWLHHDQLGSTRLVTSTAGAVAGTATYDSYGNITAATGAALPFGFAGEYRDAESGLTYLRARYYDPATAQFLSRDPAVATTREPYGYVAGNPLNRTDPTGVCFSGSASCPDPYSGPMRYTATAYVTLKDKFGTPLTTEWLTANWTDTCGRISDVSATILAEGHDGGIGFGTWNLVGESLTESGGASSITVTGSTQFVNNSGGLATMPSYYASSLEASITIGPNGTWAASGAVNANDNFANTFQTDDGAWSGTPGNGPPNQEGPR